MDTAPQTIINDLYELEYKTRSLLGENHPFVKEIWSCRSKLQKTSNVPMLHIKLTDKNSNTADVPFFEGMQHHFCNCFFDNAHENLIKEFAEENNLNVEFSEKSYDFEKNIVL